MFKTESENALVDRMGFNNPGASAVRDSLISRRSSGKWPKVPVAANIGRSKKTPNESAPSDYSQTLDILWNHADIFVLNVSSPNTPGLRELQEVDHLSSILSECGKVAERKGGGKPLLLKLSPDGSDDEILPSAQLALTRGIAGFFAPHTTPLVCRERKSTRPNSSHTSSAYAVFCFKQKKKKKHTPTLSNKTSATTSDLPQTLRLTD